MKLLDMPIYENPHNFIMTDKARSIFLDYGSELELRLSELIETVGEFASKLHGTIAIIARLLHVAENGDDLEKHMINETTVRNAI